jgi:hypothetical protein
MKLTDRLANSLTPEKLYRFNIGGAVFNLVCVVSAMILGLPTPYVHIFIASGLCFVVGAAANWTIIKLRNDSRK